MQKKERDRRNHDKVGVREEETRKGQNVRWELKAVMRRSKETRL